MTASPRLVAVRDLGKEFKVMGFEWNFPSEKMGREMPNDKARGTTCDHITTFHYMT